MDFTVDFSYPVVFDSIDPGEFTVNDAPATGVDRVDDDTVTFTFGASPIGDEGLQFVAMAGGTVMAQDPLPGGRYLKPMSATFRYDFDELTVVDTTPEGPFVTLPLNSLTVKFNEPVKEGSVNPDDLRLSVGRVTDAYVDLVADSSGQTVVFQLSGLTAEGSLTAHIPAGAMSDANDNPMAPYLTTFELDFDLTNVPTPLAALAPRGSLAYTSRFVGNISWSGDVDSYHIELDSGQTLTLIMERADGSFIEPAINLYHESDLVDPMTDVTTSEVTIKSYGTLPGGSYTVEVGCSQRRLVVIRYVCTRTRC